MIAKQDARAWWMKGFMNSGPGWNGDDPFESKDEQLLARVRASLETDFEVVWAEEQQRADARLRAAVLDPAPEEEEEVWR